MKRQSPDSPTHFDPNPNTSAATAADAAIFSDSRHFVQHLQPHFSSPLPDLNHTLPDLNHTLPSPSSSSDLHGTTTNSPDPTRQQPSPEPTKNNNQDDASDEKQRRPRGRPPRSKNKPKSPKPDPTFSRYHILEILNGEDVVDAIARFSISQTYSLRILHATGAVSSFTIRQKNSRIDLATPNERYDVMSLSGVFLYPSTQPPIPIAIYNNVATTLLIPNGKVIGGAVVRPLMASGSVFVMVELFSGFTYHRLGSDGDGVESANNMDTTSSGGGQSPFGATESGEKNSADGSEERGNYSSTPSTV